MSSLVKKCANMTQANKYVSKILKSYSETDHIDEDIIRELIRYHPTKNIDINNIEWLKMKNRSPFNKISLFYKYKNNTKEDDISWRTCIRNLYGKYVHDKETIKSVQQAFRNEIHGGTKSQYFINNTYIIDGIYFGECANCHIHTNNITTDHFPLPYKKIIDDFIQENHIDLSTIQIYENEQNEIKLQNREIASMWLNYHDYQAQYRLLCNSCNCHFGSYGY